MTEAVGATPIITRNGRLRQSILLAAINAVLERPKLSFPVVEAALNLLDLMLVRAEYILPPEGKITENDINEAADGRHRNQVGR